MFDNFMSLIYFILAIVVVFLIIIQPSKGGDLGSLAGASNKTGQSSKITFITKLTAFLAGMFLFLSFLIVYNEAQESKSSVVNSQIEESQTGEGK